MKAKRCLKCGKVIKDLPQKRPKTYCNSTCRSGDWHIKNRLELRKKREKAKILFKEQGKSLVKQKK